VNIEVFDVRGRLVRTLLDGSLKFGAGVHNVVWDGQDDNGMQVGSGIYLYRMRAGEYMEVRRMVLMK
jgi:flagellar hook assembly protein FlgD